MICRLLTPPAATRPASYVRRCPPQDAVDYGAPYHADAQDSTRLRRERSPDVDDARLRRCSQAKRQPLRAPRFVQRVLNTRIPSKRRRAVAAALCREADASFFHARRLLCSPRRRRVRFPARWWHAAPASTSIFRCPFFSHPGGRGLRPRFCA